MDDKKIKEIALYDQEKAFEILYSSYFNKLFYFSLHITQSIEDSKEIIQDVFLKAYYQKNIYDSDFKIRSWLYRVTSNNSKKYFRLVNKLKKILDFSKKDFDDQLSKNTEKFIDLTHELKSLSEKNREILYLRFYEHLNYEEISEILNIPKGTVMSRLSRAKKEFRRVYEKRVD